MMKFSEKLIKLRKESGLSQEEFGYKINVSRQAVSKWESEQSKPDVDKIAQISKLFNVSTDYLLNDDIEELNSEQKTETKPKKRKRLILKILGVILLIYMISVIYKIIGLTVLYNIANSFSEKNYWMNISYEVHQLYSNTHSYIENDIEKTNNTYLNEFRASDKEIDADTPINSITYLDLDTNTSYKLSYDQENKKYLYANLEDDDINEYFETNDIKDATLGAMLDNKVLFSLNPLNFISLRNRYIKSISFEDGTKYVTSKHFDDVGLINYITTTSDSIMTRITYSYDYVQDHFTDKIFSPVEDDDFKNQIVYDN